MKKNAPALPQGLPEALERLLRDCFKGEPQERPTSAAALERVTDIILGGVSSQEPSGAQQPPCLSPPAVGDKPQAAAQRPSPTPPARPDVTLHQAVERGDVAAVRAWLQLGQHVDSRDEVTRGWSLSGPHRPRDRLATRP
jgi:hypothetical protein